MRFSFAVPISLSFLVLPPAAALSAPVEYRGLCEASAVAFTDAKHFVVAGDESNILRLYEFGVSGPLGKALDLRSFTGFEKSDLEGAARIGQRIYWISSHSLTKKNKDKEERKVLFATELVSGGDGAAINPVGTAVLDLRDPLAAAMGVPHGELDIEGLAATPDGKLLIGLRGPQRDGSALVIPLENPDDVIGKRAKPHFGKADELYLDKMGIRSFDLVGEGDHSYLIAAGPIEDKTDGIALYWWSGPGGKKPVRIESFGFGDYAEFKPEALAVVPGSPTVAIFSDDGKEDVCEDEDDKTPEEERKFRGITFEIPAN